MLLTRTTIFGLAVLLSGSISLGVPVDEDPFLTRARPTESDTSGPVLRQEDPAPAGLKEGLLSFWRTHRYHLLTVFLTKKLKNYYRNEVGVRDEPLFWGSPPGLDKTVYDRLYDETPPNNWVIEHKDWNTRFMTLGVILASHGLKWHPLVDDLMGFYEADEFNSSVTSLVKMAVGRRRPVLDHADPAVLGEEEIAALEENSGNHRSFYSLSASRAFTHMSYADRVLAARLEGHPKARLWSGIGLYGLASYIAYSRLAEGKHYLTDVAAGAMAGILVGRTFYRVNNSPHPRKREPRVRVNAPAILPGGAEVSVSLRF